MSETDKARHKKTPILETTPNKLQKKLGFLKSYTFGQFSQKVLTPTIEEINLKIKDMNLIVQQGRRGRKVITLNICNTFYPIKTDKNLDDVPMNNWLKND